MGQRPGTSRVDGSGGSPPSSLEDLLRGLQAELAALNRRLEAVTVENTELRRELRALRAAGVPPGFPDPGPGVPTVAGGATGDCSESEGEDMDRDRTTGVRARDPSEVSPNKPRKGARRTVSEGAVPHGL